MWFWSFWSKLVPSLGLSALHCQLPWHLKLSHEPWKHPDGTVITTWSPSNSHHSLLDTKSRRGSRRQLRKAELLSQAGRRTSPRLKTAESGVRPCWQQHNCMLLEQLVAKWELINKGLSRLPQWNVIVGGAGRANGTRETSSALPKGQEPQSQVTASALRYHL